MYALTGSDFRKELTADAFISVCNNNLFPLGEMKQTILESYDGGIAKYKAIFNSVNLTLLLSLDKKDKIEVFLFKQYEDEKKEKL